MLCQNTALHKDIQIKARKKADGGNYILRNYFYQSSIKIYPNTVILSLSAFIFALMRLTTENTRLFARLNCPLVTIKNC